MDFKVWKKIKKQLWSAKEKQEVIFRPKRDDSNEKRHLETNVHSYHEPSDSHKQPQLLSDRVVAAGEQAATPKEPESIQDAPLEEIQLRSEKASEDSILRILNDLPEQWVGKEMKLRVIVDRKDATWITKRIFQDVERGLISAQFTVEELNHLCDITLTLKIAAGLASFPSAVTAFNPVFSFILTDIKSETISKRKEKIRSD